MDTTRVSLRADNGVSERILATLAGQIGTQKFNAWFKHGTRLDFDDECVTFSVPNPFVANWIETHYQSQIAEAIETHVGRDLRLLFTVDPMLSGSLRKGQLDTQADIVHKTAEGRVRYRGPVRAVRLRHQLSEFIVGDCNKLAYSAAVAVAGQNRVPFNPLFIHGHCGVGKTHLLQGICNAASRVILNGRPMNWRYVTGEQFTNEFITALRHKKIDSFRKRFRQLDLLAIDDVHFLSAKKATQDEFLHTFNTLDTAGSRIVMASDAHPRLVGELNAQLASRFLAGMVVKVDPPEQSTRMKILYRRARSMKLQVERDVLEYVARHVRGSVRELEGTLMKLMALAAMEESPVTLSMATQALADHLARTDSAVTLGDIESTVATYFGITPADIHSSRRTRTVSTARMVAVFLARRHTQMSYPEIGKAMGKNHSSIVLAVQRMEQLLAADGEVTWMSPMGSKTMPATKLVELFNEQIA